MKNVFSKITLSLVTVSMLFVVAYGSGEKPAKIVKSEDSFGLRTGDLENEDSAKPELTKYGKKSPGSGHKIKRAFQDAPPMIPHDTEGMLPITISDNQCITCHMPAAAKEMGMKATVIPKSHFTDFRPKMRNDDGIIVNTADTMKNEISIKQLDALSNARFNCSACHAPQSTGELVANTFKAKFTDKNGANKSNWNGSQLTEGLDTLKD